MLKTGRLFFVKGNGHSVDGNCRDDWMVGINRVSVNDV